MKDRCIIIGACKFDNSILKKNITDDDYVICADGGYDSLKKLGISPGLIVGDFDSVECEFESDVECVKLPCEKDDTDMLVAVKEGLARGFKNFLLLGGLGGRFDHTYANFCVLKYIYDSHSRAVLMNETNDVLLLGAGQRINLDNKKGKTVSVFPFGCKSCNVSYSGLKYSMKNESLFIDKPTGVSNIVCEDNSCIVVYKGLALIFLEREKF